jgi:hypothetical protein
VTEHSTHWTKNQGLSKPEIVLFETMNHGLNTVHAQRVSSVLQTHVHVQLENTGHVVEEQFEVTGLIWKTVTQELRHLSLDIPEHRDVLLAQVPDAVQTQVFEDDEEPDGTLGM